MNPRVFLSAIFIITGFVISRPYLYAQNKDENVALLADFERNRNSFKRDTFSLPEISNDGGQVVAYTSPEKNYKVFGLQMFGQPGKLHYLFLTDKDSNLKLVKQLQYEYHKPGAKDDFEPVKKTILYSFHNKEFNVYDADGSPAKDKDADKRDKIEKLFQQVKDH